LIYWAFSIKKLSEVLRKATELLSEFTGKTETTFSGDGV
jgi:hypothetical protein